MIEYDKNVHNNNNYKEVCYPCPDTCGTDNPEYCKIIITLLAKLNSMINAKKK